MGRVTREIQRYTEYYGVDALRPELRHYGKSALDGAPGPGSGRYPLGSGEDPYQHSGDLYTRIIEMEKSGMTEKEIASALGYSSTTKYRTARSNARAEHRAQNVTKAKAMLADGKTRTEVCKEFGISESTLRSWLNEDTAARSNAAKVTADFLRDQIDQYGLVDVGAGVELELGVSQGKLAQALAILEEEGYVVWTGSVPQATNPGRNTIIKVIGPPGTEHREIYSYDDIHTVTDYTLREDDDGNDQYYKFEYPASMDSDRLMIRYADDVSPDGYTGADMDGVIQIRRGVADLDLGESHYAQVRILVDNTHYIKGMAVYSDDLPDGVDVVFNTSKHEGQEALKAIKETDPNNPFGSSLREKGGQYYYIDENGEQRLGLINKTREEGDWGDWGDTLPSQFLSKQPMKLIENQLNLTIADKQAEYDEIMAITNPTVKKQLLEEFANECDSDTVHLQAASLPRQSYQVILPVNDLADNEIYAPNYRDGETVALVRFPHGGTFEIPILTVNNKNQQGQELLGNAPEDAVGINSNVAARLSGADFDGDTVMVIPCNSTSTNVRIVSTSPLEGLVGFDPKLEYGYSTKTVDADGTEHYYRDGHEIKIMKSTDLEMGKISNLITDMTLKGASEAELARAVRHSMVVIDAEKHKLDYKQSEIDNNIQQLKELYQKKVSEDGRTSYGADTLISRAKSETHPIKTVGEPKTDPETGEKVYNEVVETYINKSGKEVTRTRTSTQMEDTKDAHTLSSGTKQEEAYADYANAVKQMANQARLEILRTGKIVYDKTAAAEYADEVEDLKSQLRVAQANAPRERAAQLAAAADIKAITQSNPEMSKKEKKKYSQQALSRYRAKFNARRSVVNISEKQWEAIQKGAISETLLTKILNYADSAQVKSYATPKTRTVMSTAKIAKARAMRASGYTTSEIADALGVSTSTISRTLKEMG